MTIENKIKGLEALLGVWVDILDEISGEIVNNVGYNVVDNISALSAAFSCVLTNNIGEEETIKHLRKIADEMERRKGMEKDNELDNTKFIKENKEVIH